MDECLTGAAQPLRATHVGLFSPQTPPMRVGLFSIGLDAYWPQFPGLHQQLLQYNERISMRLQSFGSEVVNLGLIDTPQKAHDAGHRVRVADVGILFLHVSTYALSSTVLPVVRRAK